jgi:dTDP-4-amino-4,6-dideoxygalactose transaminase
MLTTANGEWDRQFRQGRQHGMDIPAAVRHAAQAVVFESYPTEGFNYRMTDLQAAIGREQLRRLPDIVEKRRNVADRYRNLFGSEPAVHLPTEPIWARTNWQSYCVRLPDHANQRDVMQRLRDRGIATRPGIACAHREVLYRDARRMPLPVSEEAQDRCVLLPLYAQMTAGEQDKVVDAVTEVCRP